MKKLLILCVLTSILVLMAGPVVADPNLCFDFNGDEVCDTSWDINGTETVEIYLDEWDTSPWPTEPLWGVQMFFYYDHTKIDLYIESSFSNDTIHGGPFDPSLSLPQPKGDGKYKLTASNLPQACTAITDKILLWTLELGGVTSGTSDIHIQVDFNGDPDHGAIFPGGVDCSGVHTETGGDGHATINVVGIPEDNYPPGGNGCIDAYECEGDFEPDGDVDGTDAVLFKDDFFRKDCSINPPCNGDFNCDGDVDGTDAVLFKDDFFRKDCPSCGGWPCVY